MLQHLSLINHESRVAVDTILPDIGIELHRPERIAKIQLARRDSCAMTYLKLHNE